MTETALHRAILALSWSGWTRLSIARWLRLDVVHVDDILDRMRRL